MLELKNINITLGKNSKLQHKVLTNLNIKVQEGEFIVVIGSNGSGKSTMLNVISGSLKSDSGQILINKQDVTNTTQMHRSALVSKIMQDPKISTIENMTIFENMAFAFKRGQKRGLQLIYGRSRKEFFKKKLKTLNMGLENRMDEEVNNLSGGQRQALSFIMATLVNSKILLLDEITSALDPSSSEQIIKLVSKIIQEENLTCIMITHNISHAIRYGNRLLLLKNGAFAKEYNSSEKARLTQAALATCF